jgi:hypothetical protein
MMLCLALRSSPELLYARALGKFSVEETTEGFAAARGLAMPSQPVSIQRWSLRRVGCEQPSCYW